jgi:hypothetical protein
MNFCQNYLVLLLVMNNLVYIGLPVFNKHMCLIQYLTNTRTVIVTAKVYT